MTRIIAVMEYLEGTRGSLRGRGGLEALQRGWALPVTLGRTLLAP